MNERLQKLMEELENLLNQAPVEDDCTEMENNMYSDMANLKEAIFDVLDERKLWKRKQ